MKKLSLLTALLLAVTGTWADTVNLVVDNTVSDGTSYYATFSSDKALDFTDVEGITAYTGVKSIKGWGANNLVLTEVKKVPANTGVLIKAAEAKTYAVAVAEGDVEAPAKNDLIAAQKTVSTSKLTHAYTLAYDGLTESVIFEGHDYVAVDVPAGTAYLSLTANEDDTAWGTVTVKFPTSEPAAVISSIAALKAQSAEVVTLTLSGAKITYGNTERIVIEDATAATVINISALDDLLKTMIGLYVGSTVNGSVSLTYDALNGMYRFDNMSGLTVDETAPAAEPMTVTDDNLFDYIMNYDWRWVKFSSAQYTASTQSLAITELAGQAYQVQDALATGVAMPTDDSTVDVEGFLYILDLSAYGQEVSTYFQPTKVTATGTGISSLTVGNRQDTAVYNLKGQRMAQPAKGLNIIGGKKVLVR